MPGKRLILVVDREADLRTLISQNLRRAGFATIEAGDRESAFEIASEMTPSLILLDAMDDLRGSEAFLRRLGNDEILCETQVILIAPGGCHVSFPDCDPDDCMSKPFSQRELVNKVQSLVSRSGGDTGTSLRVGPFRFDFRALEAWMDNVKLRLTFIEYRLLSLLASYRGEPVPRDVIHREVWGQAGRAQGRSMDTHIRRLRRKLGAHAGWLQTSRNSGYAIRRPAAVPESALSRPVSPREPAGRLAYCALFPNPDAGPPSGS